MLLIAIHALYLCRLLSGQGIGVEQVEEWMQLSHLQKLMRAFQDHQPTRPHIPEDTPTYRRWELEKEEREPGLLNSDEFKAAVADVLGTNQFDDQLETLFTKVTSKQPIKTLFTQNTKKC